jgi:Smr domain
MKFESGDKIALKATGEEGIFVKEIDKKMVLISINKTEFPVFATEIEHPYFNWFTDKNFKLQKPDKIFIDNVPKEKKVILPNFFGMHLVFMPVYKNISDDNIIEKVKVYLSNNQIQAYNFYYYFESKERESFKIQSEVTAQSDFYLHDISYEQLATNPFFEINCAEIINTISTNLHQYDDRFSIKPKKIFSLIEDMHLKNLPFFSQLLFNTSVPTNKAVEVLQVTPWQPKKVSSFEKSTKIEHLEKTILPVPASKPQLPDIQIEHYFTNPFEIDLHIEKLLLNAEEMTAEEKINFQMAIFTKALDTAIFRGQNSLIVIHGIGKGMLKNKIHAILNQTKQVHSYVNQHDNRFGFGATEIFFEA